MGSPAFGGGRHGRLDFLGGFFGCWLYLIGLFISYLGHEGPWAFGCLCVGSDLLGFGS